MPLYEFRCAGCGQIFDRLLPVGSDAPPCSACGSADVNRLISMIGGLVGSGPGAPRASGGGCGCGGACACGRN
ncbi:MAG: FmdB family zinc ribbon protein [Actinomycetota bacterium]